MFKIEYSILINEDGHPYISFADNYEQKPEDKFFAFEITRYIVHAMIESGKYPKPEQDILQSNFHFLNSVSSEMGILLIDQMRSMGEFSKSFETAYNFKVAKRDELTATESYYYDNKIFDKEEGLLAYVEEDNSIYEVILFGDEKHLIWSKQIKNEI